MDNFLGDDRCTLYNCTGGNDTLLARNGAADALACGVGAEPPSSTTSTRSARFQQGCETVDCTTLGGGSGGCGSGRGGG